MTSQLATCDDDYNVSNKGLWFGVGNETAGALTTGQRSSAFQITVPRNEELEGGKGELDGKLSNWEKSTFQWEALRELSELVVLPAIDFLTILLFQKNF